MTEYHGWAIIRNHYSDLGFDEEERKKEELTEIISLIYKRIKEVENPNSSYSLRSFSYGFWHLTIEGDHNHKDDGIIQFFKWIAQIAVGSYGLLYVHDDEDKRGNENRFMVWRMKKGIVEELEDNLLSPYFPTVEDPS